MKVSIEKTFDKIQHAFMIKKKNLSKLRIQGNFAQLIKKVYRNPTASIICRSEKLEAFPTAIGVSLLTASTQHCTRSPT
jgi:hypothetical protein